MGGGESDFFYDSPDGLRLYCRIFAARQPGGLPILCIPGLTRNSRDFVQLAARWSEHHEVLAVDLRGRGFSAWDPDASHYQLMTYVQDMLRLLEIRNIWRAVLIGTSLGALISMVLTAVRGDQIAGAVLNDAGPQLDPAGLRRIASYVGQLPPVKTWAEAAAQTKAIYEGALPGLTQAEWLDYAQRAYRENADGIPVPDMDPKIAAAFRNPPTPPADMWPLYAQIGPTPLLVLRGELSDLLSAQTVDRMVREKEAVEHVTVAHRGHAPLLNEPECRSAIDSFLARHARSQGIS